MKLSRILRDATVLVAFCGGFYLLTVFVARLDGSDKANKSDFSVTRLKADDKIDNREWSGAAEEFRKLTISDPYNGRAWYMLASCYYYRANAALESIRDLNEETPIDTDKVEKLKLESIELHKEAKELFLKSEEFARYRNSSLVRLAVIESREGDYDDAIQHLTEFLEFGGFTQAGLSEYPEFGEGGPQMTSPGSVSTSTTRLHDRPEFWAIVRKEGKNRE